MTASILTFAVALIVAAIVALLAYRAQRQKDADRGAAEQREAQEISDANAERRAGNIKETLRRVSDADIDRRIDDSL